MIRVTSNQAGQANPASHADQLVQQKVREETSKLFPHSVFTFEPTRENLISKVEEFIAGPWIKWSGSPGYPFTQYQDNRSVVKEDYVLLVLSVVHLLERWRDVPHDQVRGQTAITNYLQGISQFVRIFVKDEPHSTKKIVEGRERLVFSVPLVVSIAQAVLYHDQNQNEIANCSKIPAKAGWSATDEGLAEIWDYIQTFETQFVMSDDVSEWDWSCSQYWLDQETELTLDLQGARGTPWENMIRNADYALSNCIFALSDGRLFCRIITGGVVSGGRKTGSGNSHIRTLLRNTVDALGIGTKPNAVAAMGDDCVEGVAIDDPEFYIEKYRTLGFKLTDLRIQPPGGIFEFCSHIWVSRNVAYPTSWAKTFYRLLKKSYNAEEFESWLSEMRHLTGHHGLVTRDALIRYLHWVRWLPDAPRRAQLKIYPEGVVPQVLANSKTATLRIYCSHIDHVCPKCCYKYRPGDYLKEKEEVGCAKKEEVNPAPKSSATQPCCWDAKARRKAKPSQSK